MTQANAERRPSRGEEPVEAIELTGPKKVAALLLSMDKQVASRILKHFDEDDIKLIAQTATDLGAVSKETLDALIEEFATHLRTGGDLIATAHEVEQLLNGVVPPEQIAEIMQQVRSKSLQSIWIKLGEVPELSTAQYLAKEHPQVSALVLSRTPPHYAAAALKMLPGPLRNEIMRRMLSMKVVLERPIQLLEGAVKEELLYKSAKNAGPTIHARLADIINKMERKQMDEILSDLDAHRPKEAEMVRSLLFTFDDLTKLSPPALVTLFDGVPTDRTIMALYGAEPRMIELILEATPGRARRMIEQEVATGKKPSAKEIQKARRAIADTAMEMIEKGIIEIGNPEEEED
ncbi:FliG C-terminal domain-containing protein [Hyphomicrobium sp.]|uniref:flagellar motor switch protein FliG n=1 Tax=Hyphomicrobium sp. TaxID=82 RepID=UPI002C84B8FF|nr:FliG C-terminal domain-containing protein [Hyphomicrobium sp.]HRN88793.1 FliG C-terminal domain-containing protein [Hyphomicrobium sp.]HRQ25464.1 FliG C-terminal domain-containing protein [Hyphomicrobium sp.]